MITSMKNSTLGAFILLTLSSISPIYSFIPALPAIGSNNKILGLDFSSSSLASSPLDNADAANIIEYNDFLPGPHPEWTAEGVVRACMDTMLQDTTQGLEVCFAFSSDRCRAAIGGSLENFAEYANNPVFGYLIHCVDYEIINVGQINPGTPHRGAMQTCLMEAIQKQSNNDDGKKNERKQNPEFDRRSFLWTMQQERRPPLQGCWMVHEVLYTKNAWEQTL